MTVTNFDHKVVDRLAHELAPALDDRGIVVAKVTEVDNVERWRKAARRAGRLLRLPVRTAISSDGNNGLGRARTTRSSRVSKLTPPIGVATMIFGPLPFVRLFKPDQ